MSKQAVSHSEYGIDSIPELSELSDKMVSSDKEASGLYSSGSSIELSGIQTEIEASDSNIRSNNSLSVNLDSTKSESIKSLWSTSDISIAPEEKRHADGKRGCVLPNDASPFVFDGQVIRYNVKRGVDYKTPVIFGSRKLTGYEGEGGYHPSHFVFDPRTGTLAAGYDINNSWSRLPKFSLITGIGNFAQLDSSFISGSHNRIRLELPQGTQRNQPSCLIPSSCSIVGGTNNTITNTSACQFTSTIIGSHNVNVSDCEATVVLGMRGATGDVPITGFNEATFVRNLYALNRVNAGPYSNEILSEGTVLFANGRGFIRDTLQVGTNLLVGGTIAAEKIQVSGDITAEKIQVSGDIHSDTMIAAPSVSAFDISTTNASVTNLIVSGTADIAIRSIYLEGTGGADSASTYYISPSDNISVVYANSIGGQINLFLGTDNADTFFPENKLITIKDVSLEFGSGSNYNVNILLPAVAPLPGNVDVKIEHYNNGVLASSTNAGYALNTSGGAVTFQFAWFDIPGSSPTWVIKDQFIGNPRPTGLRFIPASDHTKTRLLNHK